MEKIFKIPVNKDNIYYGILTVANFALKLTDIEIQILSILLKEKIETIDVKVRETLRKVMNKDKYIINNYIKRLKEKGMLLQETKPKKLYINPNIKELTKSDVITFKFINND